MRNVLLVVPSHDQLGNTDGKTGYWLEEFASPYYEFTDNEYKVTTASPRAGNHLLIQRVCNQIIK